MKIGTAFILPLALMAGCSEDPASKVRSDFLAGCSREAPMGMCKCIFNKIEDQYSAEELASINRGGQGTRLESISHDIVRAAKECRREQ